MGMSISEAIETLLYTNAYGTADIAKRVAVNTMRKYQKIVDIVNDDYGYPSNLRKIMDIREVLEDGSN